MKECCEKCLKCPDYPDSKGHNYCHNKECHCHTTELTENNFLQTLFPCPKCAKLVRMNVDETYEEHLCFEYPTFYETVVHSDEWQAWNKVAHTYGFDWQESTEIGALSPEHFEAFLKWVREGSPINKLEYCETCVQMTNHIDNECMKHTTEKPRWEEEFDRIFVNENVWQGEDEYTKNVPIGNIKSFISQLLKEEQCCLCKDKGVIELIEEAVEADRT